MQPYEVTGRDGPTTCGKTDGDKLLQFFRFFFPRNFDHHAAMFAQVLNSLIPRQSLTMNPLIAIVGATGTGKSKVSSPTSPPARPS